MAITIKRLNLSLVDSSEVSMFKSFCKIQGIKLPDNYDEAFNVEDEDDFIDYPYVVFDELGEVKLQEEPDEDFIWLGGLEGFMYLYGKCQDKEFLVAELVHAGTFENMYIKFLEEAEEDFEYDEPESWGEPEDEEDEDGVCYCECCGELIEEDEDDNSEPDLPFKGAFGKQGHIQLAVRYLELVRFKPRRPVKDTDLFLVVYEDRTFETLDFARAYLELDVPELGQDATIEEGGNVGEIYILEI